MVFGQVNFLLMFRILAIKLTYFPTITNKKLMSQGGGGMQVKRVFSIRKSAPDLSRKQ